MPDEQRSLFDGAGSSALVRVGGSTKALTRNQRTFNRLSTRLQHLRAELAAWQRALDGLRQRVATEIEPLRRELLAEQRAALLLIDSALTSSAKDDRFTRGRRRKLRALAVVLAGAVLADGPDAEVEAIFDRHSDVPHAQMKRRQLELAETMVEAMLGDDFVEGHTATSAEELLDQASERFEARLEAEDAGKRRTRAPQGRSKRGEAVSEREASQSLRDLFRRLAATLHPDREPDAAERARKTVLMQRVNRAYAAKDLLELLTVQIEIEHIDAAHLARASDERIGHYCAVLQDQQRAVERELADLQAPVRAALDVGPYATLRPEAVDVLMERDARGMRAVLRDIRAQMDEFRDPMQRNAMIDRLDLDDPDFDELDAMLLEALSPPPPPRRGKRAKGVKRKR